eukprot:9859695-Alexandrium_andersonii.AAC.1
MPPDAAQEAGHGLALAAPSLSSSSAHGAAPSLDGVPGAARCRSCGAELDDGCPCLNTQCGASAGREHPREDRAGSEAPTELHGHAASPTP